jgi:Tol biopolymer transport system component
MKYYASVLFLILFYNSICAQNEFPLLKGEYFGQDAPKEKAEIFVDGIISTYDEPEMCASFSKDGKEFYFNAKHQNNWAIFVTKEINGRWTKPEPLHFTSDYIDRDFTISPDGNRIFFGSNRPRKSGDIKLNALDIYFIERYPSGEWSYPRNIGMVINSDYSENYPSIAANGNLYFFSNRNEGIGLCDIYGSKFVNGQYQPPQFLSNSVNSEKNDWDSFIAPDESYIIFSSQNRDDTLGGQDLYISFKGKNGSWSKAENMGPALNSQSDEICPSVSLDGKYLFFTSRRRGKADIYWISTQIISDIKNSYEKVSFEEYPKQN